MAARSDQWHVSGWPAILLVPIVLPLAIVVNLVVRIFGLKNTRDRSPGEVVGYLHDFLEGCGGEWDWDDFTSVPITALELEAIRQEAEMIDLPVTDAGRAKLQDLLARARALI
jgi:hypothetical protein